MSSKRLYFLLIGTLVLLACGLVGGTYEANKLFTAQSQKLTTYKAESLALDSEQASIAKSSHDIVYYADLDKIAKAVVPQDKNQAEAVREIVNLAKTYDINLASISFPASTLGNTVAPASGATPAAASPAATAKSPSVALSQLTPVKNIPGVYQLPITIQSDTNKPVLYSNFINFLAALENNRRTSQVSTISIAPVSTVQGSKAGTSNSTLISFNLALNEYIKP